MAIETILKDSNGNILLNDSAIISSNERLIYNNQQLAYNTEEIRGLKGEQGNQGVQGERGDKGIKGQKGSKGPQGDKGLQGQRGAQGATGKRGDKGPQGVQGDKGPTGPKGIKGEPAGPPNMSKNYDVWRLLWDGFGDIGQTIQLAESVLYNVDPEDGLTYYNSELMVAAIPYGTNGYKSVASVRVPVYVLMPENDKQATLVLRPYISPTNSPLSFNTINIPVQDGQDNAYQCLVQIIEDHTRLYLQDGSNCQLVGVYAKRGFSSQDGITIV